MSRASALPRFRKHIIRARSCPLRLGKCSPISFMLNCSMRLRKDISDEGWCGDQVPPTTKLWPESCKEVVEMSSDQAGCLNFCCRRSGCDQRHEKHGIWYPLSWDCDDEEVGLHASIILGRCVGKSQHQTRCEDHSSSDGNIQALFCSSDTCS
jgi:hypothetical protein